jgi:calcium/calmodulin-dependent protein kinase kinase 2
LVQRSDTGGGIPYVSNYPSAGNKVTKTTKLHSQGTIHRDIKPDNLLLTEDEVLKLCDFGLAEMIERKSEMLSSRSAGSPAFLPPELCVTKHGDISGKAADIWSMGATLFCLRFGRIPFERSGILELYESIKQDPIPFEPLLGPDGWLSKALIDLISRILDKNPKARITMSEIRVRKSLFSMNYINREPRDIFG